MQGKRFGFKFCTALALALCCGPSTYAQSGRIGKLSRSEARSSGLSGRDVRPLTKVAPALSDETKAEDLSRTGNSKFDVHGLKRGRRAPVAHSLDPEHITFAIIGVMIIVILTSRRV